MKLAALKVVMLKVADGMEGGVNGEAPRIRILWQLHYELLSDVVENPSDVDI